MSGIKHTAKKFFLCALAGLILLPAFSCALIPEDITRQTGTEETTAETTEPVIVHSPLLISEIMSVNSTTLESATGLYPDWIEIFNSGGSPVNLEGYQLSDRIDDPGKWVFPAREIQPGEYLVVFASGLGDDPAQVPDNELHTSFRLSGDGEDLIFTDPAGNVLALAAIPPLPEDMSYGLLDDANNAMDPYWFLGQATPGQPNGLEGFATAAQAREPAVYNLVLNEYVSRNISYPDRYGDLSDWLELYNSGSEAISLEGFTLSDDPDNPDKWSFPPVAIQPDEYLVVWLSGMEREYIPGDLSTLHASFALGSNDKYIVMHDPAGSKVLHEEIEFLPSGVSRGRDPDNPDEWFYYPRPTPGSANSTSGFAEIDGAMSLQGRRIWINEVSTIDSVRSGGRTIARDDWIELYNGTGEPVDLTGYGLTDQRTEPYRQLLDGTTIAPGEYLVIIPETFALAAGGETIWLTDNEGYHLDNFTTGKLFNGTSSGRGPDSGESAENRYFFSEPTPGEANTTPAFPGYCQAPQITARDKASGEINNNLYFSGELEISLSTLQPDTIIRYTLDGSVPDENSPVYRQPLIIAEDTVISCRAEGAGLLPGQTAVRTFLSTTRHELPVMSVQIPQADFFDPTSGIYGNYMADIEHQAYFQFFEADGTPGTDFTGGLSLHGSYSRREAQKSMQISLRALYGQDQVIYPFFPGSEVSSFRRLVLRTSGQDWKITKLRDAFMTRVVQGYTALDSMDYRPCIVYVNGEYFGLYEVREKVNSDYMASHHGADPDNVDVIKGNRIVLSGDMRAYDELINYVTNHDMRDPEAYDHVMDLIDEESLMDFLIIQSFYTNRDSGNIKFWRERSEDGQWRWVLFDLDWGLFPDTYRQNNLKYDLLDPEGHGHAKIFHTTLQVRLMRNEDFRRTFIERYAWYLNEVFATDRMLGIFDSMADDISAEMPRQIERWHAPASVAKWQDNVAVMRRIISEKRELSIGMLQDTFDLTDDEMRALFPEDDL